MIKKSKDELNCFACDQHLPEDKVAVLKDKDHKFKKMNRNSSVSVLPLKRKNCKLSNLGQMIEKTHQQKQDKVN